MKNKKNHRIINGPVSINFKIQPDLKPYNIAINDEDDSAEVELYGEVVTSVPTDFWTGEKVDGLYIALSDFLNDIESLKDKKNVTFRINSPGGEVFAGITIYNRMKEFAGTVTTVVDGLSASAASVIAQGATPGHRKVCNGGLTMIHGASTMMYGYYNSNELKDAQKEIDAIDKSIAEIYEANTGLDKDKIKSMMSKTAWMSATEAVENGFADEIVNTGEKVTMSLNSSKSLLTVNGVPMPVRGLFNLPDNIPVSKEEVPTVKNGTNKNKKEEAGGRKMTLEELMKSDPELVNQIKNEAVSEATAKEQETIDAAVKDAIDKEVERLRAIDEIASKVQNKELVEKAKYGETKMSAGDLALEALKAQEDAGQAFLSGMQKDSVASGVNEVTPAPQSGSDAEQQKNDIQSGAALIAGAFVKQK